MQLCCWFLSDRADSQCIDKNDSAMRMRKLSGAVPSIPSRAVVVFVHFEPLTNQ